MQTTDSAARTGSSLKPRARAIAFYLPQFHPIPENDRWWGTGFTEWTNVTRAKPLFKGHQQPYLPADLGFYDLRVPETREKQARLAAEAGIEGFCYWHYWFGAGKTILERPFREVLATGKPDYPFCLAWANETWKGRWYGAKDQAATLIEQTYPGNGDYTAHFNALLPAFADSRYMRVHNRPLFVVYRPKNLPDAKHFSRLWRDLAKNTGLPGIYLLGMSAVPWDAQEHGFDGCIDFTPEKFFHSYRRSIMQEFDRRFLNRASRRLFHRPFPLYRMPFSERPRRYDFREALETYPESPAPEGLIPCAVSGWDNTARAGKDGHVLLNCTPAAYGNLLGRMVNRIEHRPYEERLLFIRSWNEWAEANVLEPSLLYGTGFLDSTRDVLTQTTLPTT